MNPLQTYGLAHVTYAVSPTAGFGMGTISINSLDVGTSLSDPGGGPISFTGMNGTLTIGAAAPEPSTLISSDGRDARPRGDRIGPVVIGPAEPAVRVGRGGETTDPAPGGDSR